MSFTKYLPVMSSNVIEKKVRHIISLKTSHLKKEVTLVDYFHWSPQAT